MWTRAQLKENAKKFLKFNYWKMVLVAFIMSMIGGTPGINISFSYKQQYTAATGKSSVAGSAGATGAAGIVAFLVAFMVVFVIILILVLVLNCFVFAPLRVGVYRFFVTSHYRQSDLNELGYAFTHSYVNVVKIMFLRGLYTTLWLLLLIVPGIIKAYEYRMIPYILAENPDMDAKEAFARSKQMMTGNKWRAFVLDWSFFGWWLLRTITCGIVGIFWVNPYIHMTNAELYVALKEITYGGSGQNFNTYDNNGYTQNVNQPWNGQ